jgi:hypothetical protein
MMEKNFTPIDPNKFKNKGDSVNSVLLLIATFTAFVLAVMLFLLIQKRTKQSTEATPNRLITPTITAVTPTVFVATPTAAVSTPSPRLDSPGSTKEAEPAPIESGPTPIASVSPTLQ